MHKFQYKCLGKKLVLTAVGTLPCNQRKKPHGKPPYSKTKRSLLGKIQSLTARMCQNPPRLCTSHLSVTCILNQNTGNPLGKSQSSQECLRPRCDITLVTKVNTDLQTLPFYSNASCYRRYQLHSCLHHVFLFVPWSCKWAACLLKTMFMILEYQRH